MKQYLELMEEVLLNGRKTEDRTGVGTISLFGVLARYPASPERFPLVTTRRINWNAVVHELLWFISGDTNVKYLLDNGVNIWNPWALNRANRALSELGLPELSQQEFKERVGEPIINPHSGQKIMRIGDLGPIYGFQWRGRNVKEHPVPTAEQSIIDQLANAIDTLRSDPNSRRLVISAWNRKQLHVMELPPCHTVFQFRAYPLDEQEKKKYPGKQHKLSLFLYQRSADLPIGVPYNIASYSLLLNLVANVVDMVPGEFVHSISDAHIYLNQVEQVKKQLKREPKTLPKLVVEPVDNIDSYIPDHIHLYDYNPHPPIKYKVAV